MENSQDPFIQDLLNGPAMFPPSGVFPKLDNPPNHHSASLGVAVICTIIPTILISLHLYIKARIMKMIYFEDCASIISIAIHISYMGVTMILVEFAPVVHQWNIRLRDLPTILHVAYVGSILNGIGSPMIKITILLQIIRIFVPRSTRNMIYWIGYISIVLVFLQYFIGCFVIVFACSPRKKFWYPLMPGGKCLEIKAIYTSGAITNILSDIMILTLPQIVIWGLQIEKRRRLKLVCAFLVGIFAAGFAAARLYFSIKLARSQDFSYYIACIGLVTYPELTIGFLVSTAPILPRLFQHIEERLQDTQSRQSRLIAKGSNTSYTRGSSHKQSVVAPNLLQPSISRSSKGDGNTARGSSTRSTDYVGEEMDVFSVNPTTEALAV